MEDFIKVINEDETQPERAICNWIGELYDNIKHTEPHQFSDRIEFLKLVLWGAEFQLKMSEDMKQEDPESYNENN